MKLNEVALLLGKSVDEVKAMMQQHEVISIDLTEKAGRKQQQILE